MKNFIVDELKKRADRIEEAIAVGEAVENEIRKAEENFAYAGQQNIAAINEMQQRYIDDPIMCELLENEHELMADEEQSYRQFAEEHREILRKNKTEYDNLLDEIRMEKEKEQWETE